MCNNDPYLQCPIFETKSFLLRFVEEKDAQPLLKCYGDLKAVQFMNADNCINNFYYPTLSEMHQAIEFWIKSYKTRWFIRFSILDKKSSEIIGTIEIFGGGIGVLRIDVTPEYEKAEFLKELYQLAEKEFFILLDNVSIVTKAIFEASERRKALIDCGWNYIDQFRVYHDYYEIKNHSVVGGGC